jgi:hypothetical protein
MLHQKSITDGDKQEGETEQILDVTVQGPNESWPNPYILTYIRAY